MATATDTQVVQAPAVAGLRDIIDAPSVQSLMDDFYRLAGLPMALIDLQGDVLVGVGWQDICTRFHRVHPQTCRHCIESDTELSAGVPPGEFRLYKCKNHMWDVATPITIGGRHVGNLFSGQFFLEHEPLDYDLFRAQALTYGFDEKEYIAALERVPRLSRERLETGMNFLAKLGHMLSRLSYTNMELVRSLAERERLMRSLERAGERLNRSQEIAHLGSWDLDLDDDELTWSDEAYRIFGLQPQEFAATYEAFLERVHPDDRAAVDAAYSGSVREGRRSYEIEHRIVRKSTGEIRWVHEKCEHVFDGSGRIRRSMGMVLDVTERKRAEERLRQTQKLESIGLLAGGVAHDFNNILTAIMGTASLMEEVTPPDAAGMLDSIIANAERAAHLTRQLLAYSGKGQFLKRELDLSRMVREMRDFLRMSVPKSVDLRLELPDRLPPVLLDPGQLQQVIMNLVINAGEAIGDGRQGCISVVASAATVAEPLPDALGEEAAPGRYVCLEVTDTGPGMDEATMAKIFDPFFTTKFTGRGLGLAAVSGIVRAQKGALTVRSAPGEGSTFRVLFPAVQSAREQAVSAPAAKAPGAVLVVDDERYVREFIKLVLQRRKYDVLLAADGAEALAACENQWQRLDAVVLDIVMPVMGGHQLLPVLRARRPDLKVLLTSGWSEDEVRRLCGSYDNIGFIQKPYTAQQLDAKIQALLGA